MTYEKYLQMLEELNSNESYTKNFRKNIYTFKKSIKLIAAYIKWYKSDSSEEFMDKTFAPLPNIDPSYQARHMNIAYGLVRGKPMKQIENKVREGNEPNMTFVENITKLFMVPESKVNISFEKKPPELKMYVLVRNDLAPDHRMVQGGHAVAQYLLDHKEENWKNGTMVYVSVDTEPDLIIWERKLKEAGKNYSSFSEPDWGPSPTQTAIACVDTGEIFENLSLLTTKEELPEVKGLISKILSMI